MMRTKRTRAVLSAAILPAAVTAARSGISNASSPRTAKRTVVRNMCLRAANAHHGRHYALRRPNPTNRHAHDPRDSARFTAGKYVFKQVLRILGRTAEAVAGDTIVDLMFYL